MAGRLGKLGEPNNSTSTTSSGGRLGRLTPSHAEQEQVKTEAQKKRHDNLKANIDKIQNDSKKVNSDLWSPGNVLKTLLDTTLSGGKALFVDPAVTTYKQAETAIRGGQTVVDKGAGLVNKDLVNNQRDYIKSEQAKGTISKDKAEAELKKLDSGAKSKIEQLKTAEKKTGVKYNPSEGAFATIDAVSNATGLGEIGKVVFKSTVKRLADKEGRDLTENELSDLANKTKNAVGEKPSIEAKPTDIPDVNTVKPLRQTKVTNDIVPESPIVPPKEKKPFAPLDQATHEKIAKLVDDSIKAPVKEGMTRLYQTQDSLEAGKQSDQFFKDTDTLANFVNGRSDNAKLKFVDIPTEDVMSVPGKPEVFKIKSANDVIPEAIISEPKPTDTVTGGAKDLEKVAIEKGLVDEFKNKAEYKSGSYKEEANKAVDLVAKDYQKAIDIATRKIPADSTLHESAIFKAVRNKAIKESDGELLKKLASSPHYTEVSEAAQKLGAEGFRYDPEDPVAMIKDIQKARQKASEKINKTTVSKEVKKAREIVERNTPVASKQDWASFISELEC